MTLTLRIKKVYFDQILDGSKTHEYRADKAYYNRIFARRYDKLHLHYQGGRWLECDIVRVRRIKNKLSGKERLIVSSEYLYDISLAHPRIIEK